MKQSIEACINEQKKAAGSLKKRSRLFFIIGPYQDVKCVLTNMTVVISMIGIVYLGRLPGQAK